MEISFSQSFLADLKRIDEVVVIDRCVIGSTDYKPEIICHDGVMQICVIGAEGNCDRLDFYYGGGLAFTITGEIVMNINRTIFEFSLPSSSKATISCPWLTEDTEILEGVGPDLGSSFYKDIQVSDSSLIWKESLGKYIVDRGIHDDHQYDIELLDTKSGQLEERPIRFKSYQGITIIPGNWGVDVIKTTKLVEHEVYSEISDSSFLVWDSPMIDAKVNLGVEPECINNFGKYLNPRNIVFGNLDCFQFTNYQSSLKGFRVWGTEGSNVDFVFNYEYDGGPYQSFKCKIGEDGVAEVRISDLPYYHFNGIITSGPSRINGVETIVEIEEPVDDYIPNPDKTYVASIRNEDATIKIEGYADYIEYEKYLGVIKEVGRGTDHINSIPELRINLIQSGGLISQTDSLNKQVIVSKSSAINVGSIYNIYQLEINNNISVENNTITTSPLYSDYKIKIEQEGTIWKIENYPDYINGDGIYVYTLDYNIRSSRILRILTNRVLSYPSVITAEMEPASSAIFRIDSIDYGSEVINGERWYYINIEILTRSQNDENTWRPKTENGDPYLITLKYGGANIGISFYAIQLRKIEPRLEIWEEDTPGKYTRVDSSLNIYNSLIKSFIVVKRVSVAPEEAETWYYTDLTGLNKFYLTDDNYQLVNSGYVFFASEYSTELDLGTGDYRTKYSRVINANRSDLIGSLGMLTITDSAEYTDDWRSVIDNNTAEVEVIRGLDNIYIQVGESASEMKDEDLEISVDSIDLYGFYARSNFRYVIQAYGYLKLFDSSTTSPVYPQRFEILSGYTDTRRFKVALTRLDTEEDISKSYVEIRSGSIVRKVRLAINGPIKTHERLLSIEGQEIEKPNLIRVFNNGSLTPESSTQFYYKTTTTPRFEYTGINKFPDTTYPVFSYNDGYSYHSSDIPFTITNARVLSYSKYPMKSFGNIKEMSLSYSSSEETAPLVYPLYMKGKEHFLWCVDNLIGFSGISDPEVIDGVVRTRTDLVLDANGGVTKTFYIVSRYNISNKTFITEYPEETDFKIKRDELEATIKISAQQNIGIDERSQIEYAIPIQVSCNVENNGGNIFLGSLDYKAITTITDDSIEDIIEVDDDIEVSEGIDGAYIKDYIVSDKTQYLSVMLFQLGTDRDIFRIYSGIPDLGVEATTNYVIPEIGSNYTIISFNASLYPEYNGVGYLCKITSSYDPKYFLIRVDSDERIEGSSWWAFNKLPYSKINNTNHTLTITANVNQEGSSPSTKNFELNFIKYGYNYGFLIENEVGFGNRKEIDLEARGQTYEVAVSEEGGVIKVHAGIVYAVNGIESTEALAVPSEYKFIGENQPLEYSWTDGNLDDNGNLKIVFPPRTRDEYGEKLYTLQITQPYKYYPLNLYVVFVQYSFYDGTPDIGKEDYKIMFLEDEINVMSDGTIVGGDDKIQFVCNLPESDFNDVQFKWKMKSEEEIFNLDPFEEVEKSYRGGYIRVKFNPNDYGRKFIDAYLYAEYDGKIIGQVSVRQGYFCLISEYHNPKLETSSWIQDYESLPSRLSRIAPGYNYLYRYRQGHTPLASKDSETPCKSNNDNADTSSNPYGRAVYNLSAYKYEYYDSEEQKLEVDSLFKEAKLDFISPTRILNSYGLNYTPSSVTGIVASDYDAKVSPRFFPDYEISGNYYVTNANFSSYRPYIELSYDIKDEYLRELKTLSATGIIVLKHPDTDDLINFYIFISNICGESDEPQDIETLQFSGYSLMFDYDGGTKQVSYNPVSFRNMMSLSVIGSSTWITTSFPQDSNFISFTASRNKISDDQSTYYRNTQVKLNVIDPRDNFVLKSFYFDIGQEPYTVIDSGSSGTELVPWMNNLNNISFTPASGTASYLHWTGSTYEWTNPSSGTTLAEPLSSINQIGNNPTSSQTNYGLVWNGSSWGFSSVEGGGGTTLAEPLSSINQLASNPTSSQINYGLVWNGTAWTFSSVGGGGSTTVTGTFWGQSFNSQSASTVKGDITDVHSIIPELANNDYTIGNDTKFFKKIYLGNNVYLTYDQDNGGVHLVGAGFYTDTYVSALGANSSGGGGGGGSVTSITAGTGLSGGTITTSGTIAIDSTYQSYISHGETAYGWGDHAQAGYAKASNFYSKTEADDKFLTISFFRSLFRAYDSANTPNEIIPNAGDATAITNIKAMFGFWTEQYLSALGNNPSGGGGGGSSTLAGLNDVQIGTLGTNDVLTYDGVGHWVNTPKNTLLSGYATQSWVGQNYLGINDTAAKATKLATASTIWGQSFDGSSNISGGMTDVGMIQFSNTTSRVIDNNGIPGYGWGTTPTSDSYWGVFNHYSNGYTLYMTTGGNVGIGTSQPQYNLDVTGSIRSTSAAFLPCIELTGDSGTSYIDFHRSGSSSDYTTRLIESDNGILLLQGKNSFSVDKVAGLKIGSNVTGESYVQIGNVQLVYDETNNALKVQKGDGTAANFYATGGVSALGFGSGSGGSSVENLTVTGTLTLGSSVIADNSLYIVRQENDSDCLYLFNDYTNSKINSQKYYYNQYDNVGLLGKDYNYSDTTWWIDPDGCALFRRVYLSNDVYLYTDGSNIKVRIGSTVYTLTKS